MRQSIRMIVQSAFGFLLLQFFLVSNASAQDIGAKADEYLTAHVKSDNFNGAVLIVQRGKTLLRKGYGLANREHDIANTPLTRFRIGSITKQFTAAAILHLQEKGLLHVDDSIRKYFPDFPSYGDKIKIHHLLIHGSGLHEYGGPSREFRNAMMVPRSLQDILGRITAQPPSFAPEEKFEYSNAGFSLLGMILEKLSGKSYEAYLAENFFGPLGMNNSGYDHSETILKGRASGYSRESSGLENAGYIDMSNPYAAGALYSTIDDLYLWDQALYTEKILKKSSLDLLFRPYIDAGPRGRYAYGWFVDDRFGHKVISHGGGSSGFRAQFLRFVDDRIVIILLSNFEHTPIIRITADLIRIVLGQGYQLGTSPTFPSFSGSGRTSRASGGCCQPEILVSSCPLHGSRPDTE